MSSPLPVPLENGRTLTYTYVIYMMLYAGSVGPGESRAVRRGRNETLMRAEHDFSKGKRGAAIPQKGKTRISIFIDNAILDTFRARAQKAGIGYQTMMNEALRRFLSEAEKPLTETVLRHVLRQEIPEYLQRAAPRTHGRNSKPTKRRST